MVEQDVEFDRYARNYDELLQDPARERFGGSSEFFHRRKWSLIVDFFASQGVSCRSLSWLDVGCGRGELLGYGRSHFGRIVGCDPSEEMVRRADGIDAYLQKGRDVLPFRDGTFDFVTAVCVYHHVEEAARFSLTREIHRVLRAGGIFCVIEHNPLNPVTRLIVSRSPIDVDARLVTAGGAKRYAEGAGFHHFNLQYFLYLPQRFYDRAEGVERFLTKLPLGGQYALFARK
jgi:SAM-dependent methyltransferase